MNGVLAISDAATISLWAINLTVSLAISIILWRVAATTRKFERLEDKREKEISTLSAEKKQEVEELNTKLHDAATKLIDERFRAMTHELNNHVNGFSLALDSLKDRLSDGEATFTTLAERDQRTEILMVQKLDQVKDFIRAEMTTSEEMRRHQDQVDKRFEALDRRLGEIARPGRGPRG